ncbi:MAG TPA: DUF1444 family protein [Symbiobacteriaceae bacterium]|jgi:uncharacterized protein YtpQ (UPF0354 family)
MPRALLTEEEFSRVVASRARREWPDARVEATGKSTLVVEPEPGQRRLISLESLYQLYCEAPLERDDVINHFLASLAYEGPARIHGTFAENRHKVMPQVVPPSLVEFCRADHRELASLDYVGDLSIAFVLDEPERYAYLHLAVMEKWGVTRGDLLAAAVENLEALDPNGPNHVIGRGNRVTMVWETFDGYDASRLLLTRQLNEAAAHVPGNPVIGIPHRDYLVLFGDADPAFVEEMADRIQQDFEGHSYPITPMLFTLRNGGLAVYGREDGERVVN